jgi:serine/threonine-protein kinase RsbW
MTQHRVSYTLDSTLESVNKAEETADQIAAKTGFSEEERQRIAMSVREAMVNAVLHGNHYDPAKKVDVSYEQNGKKLIITIKDQGNGIDEQRLPDPLAPENLLKQSGRGIFLMRAFMDEVRLRNMGPGTEITLVKAVGSPPADDTEEAKR